MAVKQRNILGNEEKRLKILDEDEPRMSPLEFAKAIGASKTVSFGPDGKTVVIESQDGATKEIKKITEDEAENYEEIGAGKYFDLFYAICRGANFYKGNFWNDVCAYSDYFGDDDRLRGGWTFYKAKE